MARLRAAAGWVATQSFGILAREALKYAVLGAAAVFGAWLLTVITTFFQVQGDTWSAFFANLGQAAVTFLKSPYDYSIRAFSNDPIYYFTVLVLASGNLTLLVLLRRARKRFRATAVERALAQQAGLGGRWPHARVDDPAGAPWGELCKEIARPDNHLLYILGANGIDTFGAQGSPLYAVMQSFRGEVRAILVHPNSNETVGRAHAVGTDPIEYRRAIRQSETRLRDLRRQQHAVEGRFYTGQPNWKLIITSTTAWVQYYAAGGQHVNATPVWRFDATKEGDGLYHLFRMEFERVWRRCADDEMNLR